MASPTVDRNERLKRALLSLEGLSCGDAFGECFFFLTFEEVHRSIQNRTTPR